MKKIISILLTAVLLGTLLSVFVLPASAEDESQTDDPGITWELSEDGKTLTFTGEGAMPNYEILTLESRPWANAAETVTTVQINSGITALGDYAFCLFGKMTSVTIPESVQSIGVSAFEWCESLTSVTIPSGVKSIGASAFHYCASLESVTIPSGVTSIGDAAFCSCTSLESVTISYGVTGIGNNAFAYCSSLKSVTIPSSVTGIGGNAFDHCTSLTSVTIPYGVKSIGADAFAYCSSVKSVSFPSSITNIGSTVFNQCSNLTSVTVKAKTPPDWMNLKLVFLQNTKFKLYVPDGTSKDYKVGDWVGAILQKRVKEAYIVDDQPGENGTIMLDKDCFPADNFAEGQTVTVSVIPAEGYQLQADSLTAFYKDGEEEKTVELTQDETDPTKYYFTMLPANVTLKAAFEAISDGTGSILSGGNLWIIIGVVAVIAVGAVVAVVIVKKKKVTNR